MTVEKMAENAMIHTWGGDYGMCKVKHSSLGFFLLRSDTLHSTITISSSTIHTQMKPTLILGILPVLHVDSKPIYTNQKTFKTEL